MDIIDFIKTINPSVILEIGAHFGTETQKFREFFPDCEIISFEPDPRNIKVLKERGIDKICKLEEFAISNINGKLKFYLSSGDCSHWSEDPLLTKNDWSASSSLKSPKLHLDFHNWVKFEETVEVNSIRLDDYQYLDNKIVDFIWMDVQGAEDLVFQGATEILKRTKYLYTEYNNHELYEGQLNLDQIKEILGNDWEVIHVYSDDVLLRNKRFDNKKVIVKLMGGLGNQMYQYAFAKNISNKTGRKLILDLSHLKRRDLGPDYFYRNFELDILNINDFEIVDSFSEECVRYENYIDSDEISILNTISNIVNDKSDNIYLDGYWASPLYFSDDIKPEFFIKEIIKESESLLTEIQSTNSVMINIRRTDFLKNDFHGFYGKDYVLNAINKLQQTETDLKFFIFSDDVEWCIENLSDIPNSKIVHHTISGNKNDYSLSDLESTKRDFNLMYNCKHFIISNSTFGWWSAYLGSNTNKKVIHPEIWLKGINSTCDLLFYGLNWNKL